ncbi:MAG TPA: hypothetical protein VH116_04540 [Gemmatimonadales bacterium]|jgi:hypothetical protein|nr:hypothetical protein [Gemmatimonadales bacterium]
MATAELTYLYALAALSVSFVGFSTLLIVFRQSVGGRLTSYDTYFVLSFMEAGFIVIAGALLPPMLWFSGLPPQTVWRVASLLTALPILLFVATVPRRRRVATQGPMPLFIRVLLGLQGLAGINLVVSALGGPIVPGVAPYAAVLTVMLFTSGIAYLLALNVILPGLTD